MKSASTSPFGHILRQTASQTASQTILRRLSAGWYALSSLRDAATMLSLGLALGFALPSATAQEVVSATPNVSSAPNTTATPALAAPQELNAYGSGWRAKGTGALRFFGFKAYDATLWLPGTAGGSFGFNRPFALDIAYNTSIKASDIYNTSLIEISRVSTATPEQIKAWSAFMGKLFVDVKSGDRLMGVHLPASGARFFLNGKPLGETTDVAFSEAFFKIWLDAKARKPELRAALLGL